MLISLSRRFVFVANLKAASTSVEQALAPCAEIRLDRSEWGKHAGLARIETFAGQSPSPIDLSGFRKFGVVREPVDWLYSLYRSHRHAKFSTFLSLFTGRMTFDRFIDEWCETNHDQCAPQYLAFLDREGRHGLDATIPFETLGDVWPRLLTYLGIRQHIELGRLNASSRGREHLPISPANRDLVRQKYREDYELLRQCRERGVAGWRTEPREITPPAESGLSRETVVWGYRLILDREPESEEVIAHHQKVGTRRRLRDMLLESTEYRDSTFSAFPVADELPPMQIELPQSEEVLARLTDHLRRSWERLGAEQPHFSVITNRDFLPESFRDNEAEFWASGDNEVRLIDSTFARNGVDPGAFRSVLELGCGVGRATMHMADRFERVAALDVSAPHLAIARARAQKEGRTNIEFANLLEVEIGDIPAVDLAFSRIVLQHDAPPLMLAMLRAMLGRVKPGGAALFQLPVYMRGYAFRLEDYLKQAQPGMEMHCLPQAAVLNLLNEAGFRLVEVRENDDIGRRGEWISNIFFAVRIEQAGV